MNTTKKILMVVAFKDFRDEEYFIPKEIFERNGFAVITASSSLGTAKGLKGGEAKIDILMPEVIAQDYEAIVFVGGPGAQTHAQDVNFHSLAQNALRQNKILGAICIAPIILAKAGVLKGKRATVWSHKNQTEGIGALKDSGAHYEESSVVADGKIVTASGPLSAEEFAHTIVEMLS